MTGRKIALTYAGAESKFGIACDSATPSEARQTTPARDEDREHEPVLRQPDAEEQRARGDDERQLDRGVRDRVRGQPAEVGAAGQRRAAQALEHALLAQEDHVHRERDERRRHDAHAGDAGHDDVEVLLAGREDRAEEQRGTAAAGRS